MIRLPRKSVSAGLGAIAAAAFAVMSASQVREAAAEPSVFTTLYRTCTAINCSASSVRGSISGMVTGSFNSANPWLGQFILSTGRCARFHVTSQTADLEMTVVGPSGIDYTNDDFTGLQPRVVVANPQSGVHTVVLNRSDGSAVDAQFVMKVAQYNSGNPNCASPTPGAGPASRLKKG